MSYSVATPYYHSWREGEEICGAPIAAVGYDNGLPEWAGKGDGMNSADKENLYWRLYFKHEEDERPRFAVANRSMLRSGDGWRTSMWCPEELILGRSIYLTQEELAAYHAGKLTHPSLHVVKEDDINYIILKPTRAQTSTLVERFNRGPLPLTGEERTLLQNLREILPEQQAFEVMAASRWDENWNIVYELYVPELSLDDVQATPNGGENALAVVFPERGVLALSCGEVPCVAVGKYAKTGLLRVVTFDEMSTIAQDGTAFEIYERSVLDVNVNFFVADKPPVARRGHQPARRLQNNCSEVRSSRLKRR